MSGMRHYGQQPSFDPRQGRTVIDAPGSGAGYWAGAPSVVFDPETQRYYLYYRVRKPRPVRGGECYIAESEDGVSFRTIWSGRKEDLGSESLERFCLLRALDGRWLLYASYVDPADERWCIDVVEADHPSAFDLSTRRPVLRAADTATEGIKDPWVMVVNGLYVMLVSYAAPVEVLASERARMHVTADVYNTGLTLSATGLATSGGGRAFDWSGEVFAPAPGRWDAYAARLGCLLPTGSGWLGYYDGGAGVSENYEERTGLVQTWDLRTFYRLSPEAPAIVSPEGTGSLRYIDAVVREREVLFYYEYARADGSHELRMSRAER